MPKQKKLPLEQNSQKYSTYYFPLLQEKYVFLFFTLIVIFFFREIIFQSSFLWEDFLVQYFPFRNFATVSLAKGEIPLWNPYTFGGMPFLADIQTAVFYLPNVLLIPFVQNGKLPIWYVELLNIAHYPFAGISMYYCAKSFLHSKVASAFSAFVYMLSGFAIVHAIHPVFISQLALFPLVVFLFRKVLQNKSLMYVLLCGFVLSQEIFSGSPQFSFYVIFFLFIYFLFDQYHLIKERKKIEKNILLQCAKHSLLASGVIAVAIGISAIQLFPTIELSELSTRSEISYSQSLDGQLFWQQLVTFFVPKFFGSFSHLDVTNPAPYWGPGKYFTYWEANIYTGICALFLAIYSFSLFKKNNYVAFFGCFAVFSVLYALGDNFIFHKFFYEFIPGFDKFRSVGRFGFFTLFSIALLSGFGLQKIFDTHPKQKMESFFLTLLVTIGGCIIVIAVVTQSSVLDNFIHWQIQNGELKNEPIEFTFPLAQEMARTESLYALGITFAVLTVLILLMKKKLTPSVALALIFGVQFFDIYTFGFDQNNGKENAEQYFSEKMEFVKQIKIEEKENLFRINSRDHNNFFLDRNQGMIDELFLMEGYTPLALQKKIPPSSSPEKSFQLMNTKYRLRIVNDNSQEERQREWSLIVDSSFLPRAFFVYRQRTFSDTQKESLFMISANFNPREVVTLDKYSDDFVSDTISTTNWKVTFETYNNNDISLKVFTPKKGFLVLSEIYYPGWNAYIDGKQTQIYKANYCLRTVVVDSGEHNIVFRFEPESFYSGLNISIGTIVFCVVGLMYSIKKSIVK